MSDCRVLGGRFQGPGTSCGGHYIKPVMMGAEQVEELPLSGDNILEKELWVGNDSSQADATAQNYLLNRHPNKNIIYTLSGLSDYNKVLVKYMFVTDEKEYHAPPGKVFHDPAAAKVCVINAKPKDKNIMVLAEIKSFMLLKSSQSLSDDM